MHIIFFQSYMLTEILIVLMDKLWMKACLGF